MPGQGGSKPFRATGKMGTDCPARSGTAPSMPATAAATTASSRDCRAGSTTIRCGPATGTCSTAGRVISAAGWAADVSASASPRAHRACRSPAAGSVAAVRSAAASGGADPRASQQCKTGQSTRSARFRLRRDDQATSLANRSASTLPPESTMTTFLPLASMRPASSAARPTAPPGSTTSFNSR